MPRQRPSESRSQSQVARLAFEEFLRELPVHGKYNVGRKSTCLKVLGKPAPCASDFDHIARWTMCLAFHSPTNLSGREHLVEHFRKNVRSAWSRYRRECRVNEKRKYR